MGGIMKKPTIRQSAEALIFVAGIIGWIVAGVAIYYAQHPDCIVPFNTNVLG